jgi:predicted RNA-binding protein YlxR (DUF448 family)
MLRQKRIPMRKCVACQEMMNKKSLIRIVRTPEGEVRIDPTGKKSGRGAYLCTKVECFQLAKKKKSLDRALKHSVSNDIYGQLEDDFIKVQPELGNISDES